MADGSQAPSQVLCIGNWVGKAGTEPSESTSGAKAIVEIYLRGQVIGECSQTVRKPVVLNIYHFCA